MQASYRAILFFFTLCKKWGPLLCWTRCPAKVVFARGCQPEAHPVSCLIEMHFSRNFNFPRPGAVHKPLSFKDLLTPCQTHLCRSRNFQSKHVIAHLIFSFRCVYSREQVVAPFCTRRLLTTSKIFSFFLSKDSGKGYSIRAMR